MITFIAATAPCTAQATHSAPSFTSYLIAVAIGAVLGWILGRDAMRARLRASNKFISGK